MIKIIVPDLETKEKLIEESEYLHWLENIDTDKANTLCHLYMLPDEAWIIEEKPL